MEEKKAKRQLNIELPEDIAEGLYANLAMVNHSNSEFVLDFIRIIPNMGKGTVKSRIVITPQHAKALVKVMAEHVKRYEATFGPITENKPPTIPMNFNSPKAQA